MHIVVVGLSHRSAPVDVRERLAFRPDQLGDAFAKLRRDVGLHEAAILSTCNRVEIYAGVSGLDGTVNRLHQFLSEHGRMDLPGLTGRLYSYVEPWSIHHLFAVTSGLDSMVLGEAEILQQVKHAYQRARDHGATGKLFHALFQRALNAAKAVRTETAIGHGGLSIGAVAVQLSEKIFGNLSDATVLLIGAGKIGTQTLKRLALRGVRNVRVVNRSPQRAEQLAAECCAVALPLEDLLPQLAETDIVISSAGAADYLLRRADVIGAMRARRNRPLCIVDVGVPRNVEPAVGQLDNVYLFDIDDLQGSIDHVRAERQQALDQSRAIINRKVDRFLAWWQHEDLPCAVGSSLERVAAR